MAVIDIFNLPEPSMTASLEGQKILIYGGNDRGKTYQACKFPKPLLCMAESGGNALKVKKVPIRDWNDFTNVVKSLTTQYDKAKELYQTIIIDTAEELVSLSEQNIARRFGCLDVGSVQDAEKGNPNGYSLARTMFKNQINLLTKYDYTVIFIMHETKDEDYLNVLTGETVTKIVPFNSNKEKGSTAFIKNLCDFCFYIQEQGINPETGDTIMSKAICKETKSVFARSRYQIQSFIDPFTADNMVDAIKKAIEKSAENEGADLVEKSDIINDLTKEDYFNMIKPYITKCFKLAPDYVKSLIENKLGVGRKISSATDDEIAIVASIYSELVDYCCDRGIVVDE